MPIPEADQLKKIKDPDARLDYVIDWTEWLPEGDTITAAVWDVTAAADGVVIDDSEFASPTTTVWLSGGMANEKYNVTCHITTAGGREDDRTLVITCKEK